MVFECWYGYFPTMNGLNSPMDDCILVTNERIYQLCLIYFVFCSKNNNIKVFTPNIVCNGFLVLVRVFSNDE